MLSGVGVRVGCGTRPDEGVPENTPKSRASVGDGVGSIDVVVWSEAVTTGAGLEIASLGDMIGVLAELTGSCTIACDGSVLTGALVAVAEGSGWASCL